MAARGEREGFPADHASCAAGRNACRGLALLKQPYVSRSRKDPGPLIQALHAWLLAGPPGPPLTEDWLLSPERR